MWAMCVCVYIYTLLWSEFVLMLFSDPSPPVYQMSLELFPNRSASNHFIPLTCVSLSLSSHLHIIPCSISSHAYKFCSLFFSHPFDLVVHCGSLVVGFISVSLRNCHFLSFFIKSLFVTFPEGLSAFGSHPFLSPLPRQRWSWLLTVMSAFGLKVQCV